MKSTIAKKTEGYGYKYTELADINKYCEDNGIRYFQEIETSEINQKDYIITYLVNGDKVEKHRGCQIVEAVLSGIKNPVQEYGSSLTYCRRYSLLMALGLATEDDDGASLTQEPTKEEADNYVIDFGKHKGKKLNEVPKEYLEWMLGNAKNERIKKLIELATGIKIPDEEEQEQRIDFTNEILRLADEKEIDLEEITTKFKVDGISDMTTEQMKKCIVAMQKKEV
jgi:uncharacterized protein (DUF3820 family)